MKTIKDRKLSGFTDNNVREYEIAHAAVARRAAGEGMVLLKNNGILPLEKGSAVALYGQGAGKTIKGGTGSGEVNSRGEVSVYQGLKNAGFIIVNEDYNEELIRRYDAAKTQWHQFMREKSRECRDGLEFFEGVYVKHPFVRPEEPQIELCDTDTAVYVISRLSGEGYDRSRGKGDYCLSDREEADIDKICANYKHVILVLNVGGCIDLSVMDKYENIDALLLMGQAGQEGGNALADIFCGRLNPCGRLSDSWAYHYEDYPCAEHFSSMGNALRQEYREGIYVGYRWFDSFDIPVRFSFGHGLSYTSFGICPLGFECVEGSINTDVKITNTGKRSGREVVQLYVSCPHGRLDKEFRRLAAFEKTLVLAPGESCVCRLTAKLETLASYDENTPGWILEAGRYSFWCGDSLGTSEVFAAVDLDREVVIEKTRNLLSAQESLDEFKPECARYVPEGQETCKFILRISGEDLVCREVCYDRTDNRADEAGRIADSLSTEQLIHLVCGEPSKGHGSTEIIDDIYVPGAAAETSSAAIDAGVASISLADGPAGLRLAKHYDTKGGKIISRGILAGLEGGAFCPESEACGVRYYQYCTAFPVGTMLAQTWDRSMVMEVGRAAAEELDLFGVTLWLAPGMNIHRNPLCGRNFEYYSEDPFLSGNIAAAITQGVQSVDGCGATIKHFAANNAENERMRSDSVMSERCLREIYLKGFEIAVKSARPMAIMTSYNLINGVHAANNRELCTHIARDEWGFDGVIMTDWTTTLHGPDCTATGCIMAGNDLIMPGDKIDIVNLRDSFASGELDIDKLRLSAARVIRTVLKSSRYK